MLYLREESARQRLAEHLDFTRLGDERAEAVAQARHLAATASRWTWTDFMDDTSRVAREALTEFNVLFALSPAETAADMRALLDHERAVLAFAEGQLSGRGGAVSPL